MAQKLDPFKKILLATGQINYLSSTIQEVIEGAKIYEVMDGIISDRVEAQRETLDQAAKELTSIMETLAEIANGQDFVLPIDERISRVPFEILLHDMDDVEMDYEISKPG